MEQSKIQNVSIFNKRIYLIKTIIVFLIIGLIFSCKKESNNLFDNNHPKNLERIFDEFWLKMNDKYVFWDQDKTDWNLVFKTYKPLFKNLGYTIEDKTIAAGYFKEMTKTLLDNHFNIFFNDGPLINLSINPGLQRKLLQPGFHEHFNYVKIVKGYLDDGYFSANVLPVYNGSTLQLLYGKIGKKILYLHCNHFTLKKAFESKNENDAKRVLNFFFSQLKLTSEYNGIILDLRDNEGGNLEDLNFFAGKLIANDINFGYSRSKSGTGKYDYLPWVEARLLRDEKFNTTAPIIILANSLSSSLSEIMILALKSKKNKFVGERTYGATGPISDSNVFNSGSFDIGDFMTIKTSSAEFKDINGKSFESVGVFPDIEVPFNFQNIVNGRDLQLEMAISLLK